MNSAGSQTNLIKTRTLLDEVYRELLVISYES